MVDLMLSAKTVGGGVKENHENTKKKKEKKFNGEKPTPMTSIDSITWHADGMGGMPACATNVHSSR